MRLDFVVDVGASGTGVLRYPKLVEGFLTSLYKSNANGQTGAVTVTIREILPFNTPVTLYTFTGLSGTAKRTLQAASYGSAGTPTGSLVSESIHNILEVTVTGATQGKCYISLGMIENGGGERG